MDNAQYKVRIAYMAELNARMGSAKRHERMAIIREAAASGLRFTIIDGAPRCVEAA